MTENGGVASVTNPRRPRRCRPAAAHLGGRVDAHVPARCRRHQHAGPRFRCRTQRGDALPLLPSKRDLLIAVLDERGFLQEMVEAAAPAEGAPTRWACSPTCSTTCCARCSRWTTSSGSCWARSCVARRPRSLSGASSEHHPGRARALAAGYPARALRRGPGSADGEDAALHADRRLLRACRGVLEDDDPAIAFRRRAEEAAAVLLSVRGSTEKP